MTVQEILNTTNQLSTEEQLQMAICLLKPLQTLTFCSASRQKVDPTPISCG